MQNERIYDNDRAKTTLARAISELDGNQWYDDVEKWTPIRTSYCRLHFVNKDSHKERDTAAELTEIGDKRPII